MAAQDKSSVVTRNPRGFAGSLPTPQIDLLPLGLPGNPRYFKSEIHVAATGAHETCRIDNGTGRCCGTQGPIVEACGATSKISAMR
jgi:hypothetical protein